MKSQKDFVKNELLANGCISRNYCLDLYSLKVRPNILRLGAIICDLKKEGWEIEGSEVDTPTGLDFVYTLKNSPIKITRYYVPDLGREIIKYE